jgi:hypothetical protein
MRGYDSMMLVVMQCVDIQTRCHAPALVFCVFFIILVRSGCDMGIYVVCFV